MMKEFKKMMMEIKRYFPKLRRKKKGSMYVTKVVFILFKSKEMDFSRFL